MKTKNMNKLTNELEILKARIYILEQVTNSILNQLSIGNYSDQQYFYELLKHAIKEADEHVINRIDK